MLDILVAPAISDDIALYHFPEQVGSAASRVFLFASHAKTRTHDAAFISPAFAHSYASQHGPREAALVLRKLKMCFRLPWPICDSQTQIVIKPVRVDHFARVHLPVRIPDSFEFVEGLHQLRSEHFGEELCARLTVSVLARNRSAIADHKISGLLYELSKFGNTILSFEIEVDAVVNAAIAEVPQQPATSLWQQTEAFRVAAFPPCLLNQ